MGEDPISWWAVLCLYLAPALSSIFQLRLSRSREFLADAHAARLDRRSGRAGLGACSAWSRTPGISGKT